MQRSPLTTLGMLIVAGGLALSAPASAQDCEAPPPPPTSPPNAEVPAPTPDKPTA